MPLTAFSSLDVAAMGAAADRAVTGMIERGAGHYVRSRHLPGLVRVSRAELDDYSQEGRELVVLKLEAALRGCNSARAAGRYHYNFDNEIALRSALLAERRGMQS